MTGIRSAIASRIVPAILSALGFTAVLLGLYGAAVASKGPASQVLWAAFAACGVADLLLASWLSAPPKGARS